MKKGIKFKLAALLALVVGRGAGSDGVYAQNTNQRDSTVKKEAKLWPENLTIEQAEDAIKRCDKVLARLQKKIDTKGIGADERYEAVCAHADIMRERKLWVKKLESMRAEQAKTIDIRNVKKTR